MKTHDEILKYNMKTNKINILVIRTEGSQKEDSFLCIF